MVGRVARKEDLSKKTRKDKDAGITTRKEKDRKTGSSRNAHPGQKQTAPAAAVVLDVGRRNLEEPTEKGRHSTRIRLTGVCWHARTRSKTQLTLRGQIHIQPLKGNKMRAERAEEGPVGQANGAETKKLVKKIKSDQRKIQ